MKTNEKILKTMDPEDVKKSLEGHEDIITPELERADAYFESLSCLNCGGSMHKVVDASKLFESSGILPKFLAECTGCGSQFDPDMGIEVKGPNA